MLRNQGSLVRSVTSAPAQRRSPVSGVLGLTRRIPGWQAAKALLVVPGIAFVLYGEKLISLDKDVMGSTPWYLVGLGLILFAWYGTERDVHVISDPHPRGSGARRPWLFERLLPVSVKALFPGYSDDLIRFGALSGVLALGAICSWTLTGRPNTTWAGIGWLLSLAAVVVVFWSDEPLGGAAAEQGGTPSSRISRLEAIGLLAIVAIGIALRLYRLGDWTTGIHGDEGEVGKDALSILEGRSVSPFTTGWYGQTNFYYWTVAIAMKLFGTDLFGLRITTAIFGICLLFALYALVRLWFGPRMALVSTALVAISDVAVHFSRQQFTNITVPLFLALGTFFLFHGLKHDRRIDFVWAGYATAAGVLAYQGGRLTPAIFLAMWLYLLLVAPALQAGSRLREGSGVRLSDAIGILKAEYGRVRPQLKSFVVFWAAVALVLAPWIGYELNHQEEFVGRAREMLIFNQAERATAQYHVDHSPLVPGVPFFQDAFWPRVLVRQAAAAFSVFTHSFDTSSIYTFSLEPVTKPVETALFIIGLVWTAWRWRDTRFAMLSIWFWATFLAGGVLTIDPPYFARMVGLIPLIAVFAALPLEKLTSDLVQLVKERDLGPRSRYFSWMPVVPIVGLLAFLLGQNAFDYFGRYLASYPSPLASGQALFVRQMRDREISQGRPAPEFYSVGAHLIYWNYGVNAFLNHDMAGKDLVNLSDVLPLVNNKDRDVVFMVYDNNIHFLAAIKGFYPGGEEIPYRYGPSGREQRLFTGYVVSREEIQSHRSALATYSSGNGQTVERDEASFGTVESLPPGLDFPVDANWSAGVRFPEAGRYTVRVRADGPTRLLVNGSQVLTIEGGSGEQVIVLPKGLATVELAATLGTNRTQVQLDLVGGPSAETPLLPEGLWNGTTGGFVGTVEPDQAARTGSGVPIRRIDPVLAFKDTGAMLGFASSTVRWEGSVLIQRPGPYTFELLSNGESSLQVDGQEVVRNAADPSGTRRTSNVIVLQPGNHNLQVVYRFSGGAGFLELTWVLPEARERSLVSTQPLSLASVSLAPAGEEQSLPGAPPAVTAEPAVVPAEATPAVVSATTVATTVVSPTPTLTVSPTSTREPLAGGPLLQPRGVAVGPDGELYVGDRGHRRVALFDSTLNFVRAWDSVSAANGVAVAALQEIVDVAWGPSGVFVLDSRGERLYQFNPDGSLARILEGPGVSMRNPTGVEVTRDGVVLVADTGNSRILRFTADSSTDARPEILNLQGQSVAPLEQPLDVAADPGRPGVFYVVDLRGRVLQFDASGRVTGQWNLPVSASDGGSKLAVARDGSRVYITDPERSRIAILQLADGRVSFFGGPGDGRVQVPSGISVGEDGSVYVVDRQLNAVIRLSI